MNRYTKSLLATYLPPIAVFLFFYFIIRIDIYSSVLLTVVTLAVTLIRQRTRHRMGQKPIATASAEVEKELSELMAEGKKNMAAILTTAKKVKSRDVSQNAMALYQLGDKIMTYLTRNPEKISKARRFFNYYLETTEDILTKYYEFERTGIASAEVIELEDKTSSALITLQDSYRKQYVRLVRNEMMDIEADIDLLEKTNRHE